MFSCVMLDFIMTHNAVAVEIIKDVDSTLDCVNYVKYGFTNRRLYKYSVVDISKKKCGCQIRPADSHFSKVTGGLLCCGHYRQWLGLTFGEQRNLFLFLRWQEREQS